VVPCVPRLQIPPPKLRGLRLHHVSSSTRPHLPDREGSGAVTCPVALSLLQVAILKKFLAYLPTLSGMPTRPKAHGASGIMT
jgi:hypothetical protein